MKIVVCVKQVPATNDAKIDPETKRIIREGTKAILNPFDTYAIEEAVQLKKKFGGEIIALSMGPEKAEHCLREAISVGVDRAILLSDRAFSGSDTWATSNILANAIQKIGDVDLVICGKQAIDGDTAQVGPGIASHLNWQQATQVIYVDDFVSGKLIVDRMHENGADRCALDLPSVITVVKGINTPRVPTLKGCLASKKADIPIWKPADLNVSLDEIGLNGSPTRVVRTEPPVPRPSLTVKIAGTPEDCIKKLKAELIRRNQFALISR